MQQVSGRNGAQQLEPLGGSGRPPVLAWVQRADLFRGSDIQTIGDVPSPKKQCFRWGFKQSLRYPDFLLLLLKTQAAVGSHFM